MESKSGFKECSRCGLRNKPTAKQCDFCGQKLEAVDEWEIQVDALEKLSKEAKRIEVTEDLTKKIEATIIRREPIEKLPEFIEKEDKSEQEPSVIASKPEEKPTPELEVEEKQEESSVPETLAEVEQEEISVPEPLVEIKHEVSSVPQPKVEESETTTVVTFTTIESKPVEVRSESPVVEEAPIVKIEEPTFRGEIAHPITPEPLETVQPEEAPPIISRIRIGSAKENEPRFGERVFKWRFDPKDRKSVVFMTLFILGIFIYISSIVISSSLGTIGSWSAIAMSSLMVVIGISKLAIDWSPVYLESGLSDEIIEICPECNERVSAEDERCPACGTEFEPSDHV